jgi:para-nitrobenzyl esterase
VTQISTPDVETAPTLLIDTPSGRVRGLVRPDGTGAFLGLRYARADRFAPASPEAPWPGERDATHHGPICPQAPGLLESTMGAALPPMSEDCLSLGVFVPPSVVTRSATARPVLVWIHGGAYVNGSGSTPWYDGSSLARRGDAIVVSINYRLGVFGFFRDNNLGLLDQIEALRWVQKHIASFGGDPNNVTIFGESAGGSSVVALMASPSSAGLFHKVWSMSPSIGQYRNAQRGDELADKFLRAAGVSSDDELLALSTDDLLAAQGVLLAENGRAFDYFAPTWPGAGLPREIVSAAADHPAHLVVGTTRDENRLFGAFSPDAASMDDAKMRSFFAGMLPDRVDEAIALYREHRPGETDAQLVMAAQTDEGFRQRAIRLAEKRAKAGTTTHMYWFTWASPAFGGVLGSCHAIDIPFTFHNLDQPGVELFTGDGADRQVVADQLAAQVLSFATAGSLAWSEYDLADRRTFRFDVECGEISDPEPALRALWSR